jgi:hypothetical protein
MKLGIVVVYLVSERDEGLLRLHLAQIERCTRVPYGIYAGVNRLLPQFRTVLEENPRVQICDCRTVDLRESREHVFYLEHLIQAALDDGCTHIATLHMDSFPIREGWAEMLAGLLSDACPLAAVMTDEQFDRKPNTACIFFRGDFYQQHRPKFLLSEEERSTSAYAEYRRAFTHIPDSGVGFGYELHIEGLTWHPLVRSDLASERSAFGGAFGGLIFHLGGASWFDFHMGTRSAPASAGGFRTAFVREYYRFVQQAGGLIPGRLRPLFRPVKQLERVVRRRTANRLRQGIYERERQRLLDDPEAYVRELQTGGPD